MCRRPTATITEDAAGNRDPMTTQQMSTAQKTSMRACRVSGGRPNRAASLSCFGSMVPFNGRLFHLRRTGMCGPAWRLVRVAAFCEVGDSGVNWPLERDSAFPPPCGHAAVDVVEPFPAGLHRSEEHT